MVLIFMAVSKGRLQCCWPMPTMVVRVSGFWFGFVFASRRFGFLYVVKIHPSWDKAFGAAFAFVCVGCWVRAFCHVQGSSSRPIIVRCPHIIASDLRIAILPPPLYNLRCRCFPRPALPLYKTMSEFAIPDKVKEILSRLPVADQGMISKFLESRTRSFFSRFTPYFVSCASSLHRRNAWYGKRVQGQSRAWRTCSFSRRWNLHDQSWWVAGWCTNSET